ncbi:MAG: hypothetical protein EBS06_09570, partial [Proteobacteria bacterium]|nr:hypothetical protein [Pseudomonadota bacterium]
MGNVPSIDFLLIIHKVCTQYNSNLKNYFDSNTINPEIFNYRCVLNSNILIQSNSTSINNSIINTSTNRSFTITYTSTTSTGLTSSATRILNVYQLPIINSIILSTNQNQINVSLTGVYYYSTYTITLNNVIVISETVFNTNTIDISSLISNILSYTITIKLKRLSGTTLTSNSLTFFIDKSAPIITNVNPLNLQLSNNPVFNVYTSVNVIDLPSNNPITLSPSNIILIQDNYGNNIPIPPLNNGFLNTTVSISYTIIYTITDSLGNNNIIPYIVNIVAIVDVIINNWMNRVNQAGGSLSSNEIQAHRKFLNYLVGNNYALPNILRLNTFCGDSLNAALCPIIIDGG